MRKLLIIVTLFTLINILTVKSFADIPEEFVTPRKIMPLELILIKLDNSIDAIFGEVVTNDRMEEYVSKKFGLAYIGQIAPSYYNQGKICVAMNTISERISKLSEIEQKNSFLKITEFILNTVKYYIHSFTAEDLFVYIYVDGNLHLATVNDGQVSFVSEKDE